MIYDSMIGRAPGSDIDPLVTNAGEVIHIGGEPDPEQAGISDLDIERVVELYPPGSEHSHSKREESDSVPGESHSTPGEPQEKQHVKRWWSVQEEYDANSMESQPWPAANDGKHTITYCFETVAVWNALGAIWTRALAKWAVALQASSLKFLPDPVCDQQARNPCICSTPGMADETLRIMQAPKDQRLNYAESSLGFRPPNFPIPNGRPQHFMIWPANANFFGDPPRGGLVMAHELGM